MRKLPLCIYLTVLSHALWAQAGTWTWIKGDTILNSVGHFGTQGIADPINSPRALIFSATWTDLQGNFWMLGGWNGQIYNALWKFDPVTENWTWMKGSYNSFQPGVYGVQGIPSVLNTPPALESYPLTWVDSANNLWLYGGFGYCGSGFDNELAALWKYDTGTNEWTWVNGSQQCHIPPDHGMLNIPDPSNTPGSRYQSSTAWRNHDTLFLFGGRNQNLFGTVYSDLWKYDLSTNEWTWIKGPALPGQPGSYGTQGMPDSSNNPGARSSVSCWTDLNGDFWMFGSNYYPLVNDVWKYNPASNIWTWMGGSSSPSNPGNYLGVCSADTSQLPKAKQANSASWRDAYGFFYNFGGGDLLITYSDLWAYCPERNKWVLINGSDSYNQPNHYGIQGVSDPANTPSSRFGSSSWIDSYGRLWLWGGANLTGQFSEMWRFEIDYSCFADICAINSASFIADDPNLCEKFCTDFYDQSIGTPTSWQWEFPGGTPSFSFDQNPSQICYQTPGIYDVTLITGNANGSDTLTIPDYITIYPTPPFPTITQSGYTIASSSATSYQWQFNNIDIPAATNQSYDVQQSGYYTVFITDQNGCVSSTSTYILIDGIEDLNSNANLLVYPNPSNGSFIVELLNCQIADEFKIEIRNTVGQIVYAEKSVSVETTSNCKKEINLGDAINGIYFIEITWKNELMRKKIIIAK
jgi:hypothetical protein